jgi:hypothetical protein
MHQSDRGNAQIPAPNLEPQAPQLLRAGLAGSIESNDRKMLKQLERFNQAPVGLNLQKSAVMLCQGGEPTAKILFHTHSTDAN